MGRIGYFGCLVVLGVLMMAVSCVFVFGATGAITAEPGERVAQADKPPEPVATARQQIPTIQPLETPPSAPPKQEPAQATQPAAATPTARPVEPSPKPAGTLVPKPTQAGAEENIAQRLEREAVGGGIRLTALGAAKTSQGERSVLAIYVRVENDGSAPVRLDPTRFRIVDRLGTEYPVSPTVEASLPAIELAPRSAPGESGKRTEGNLTFELPKSASGLALVYELPEGQPLRIPLPPEFG